MQLERSDSAATTMGYPSLSSAKLPVAGGQRQDLIEKAFHLAYFLVQDRSTALAIVAHARKKLGVEHSRERKRSYWRRGLRQKIRRMTRDEQDALQWLIYREADPYERRQEQEGIASTRLLRVRYIKSILQMTTNMSPFYVAVGLYRILHNYSTPEIQDAYELLTADFAGTEKYRRVKRALMQKLAGRFGQWIAIRQTENQELRFAVSERPEDSFAFATECLELFTPWSTQNSCLPQESFQNGFPCHALPPALRQGRRWDADLEETKKCHVLIHPPCFDQLAHRLRLDPRSTRLAMPDFKINDDLNSQDRFHWAFSSAPMLTDQERNLLAQTPAPAHSDVLPVAPRLLTVLADGVQCAQLDLSGEGRVQWKVSEGTRLIEFCAGTAEKNEVLAVHWIDYTDMDGIAAGEHTVRVLGKRKLILTTLPANSGTDEAGGAIMSLAAASASHFASWKESAQFLGLHPRLPVYALAGILVLLGWLWSIQHYQNVIRTQQSVIAKAEADRRSAEAAAESLRQQLAQVSPPAVTLLSYRLLPDSLSVRGSGNAGVPVIPLPRREDLVQLQLPLYGYDGKASYRATLKLFSDKTEVLREDRLKPAQTLEGWVVVFTLPASVVNEKSRYVITLESVQAGKPKRTGDFSFSVKRSSP